MFCSRFSPCAMLVYPCYRYRMILFWESGHSTLSRSMNVFYSPIPTPDQKMSILRVIFFRYGAGLQGATNTSAGGLYDSAASDKLGISKGLRQYYRYGIYSEFRFFTPCRGIWAARSRFISGLYRLSRSPPPSEPSRSLFALLCLCSRWRL